MTTAQAQSMNLADDRVSSHAKTARDFACSIPRGPKRLQRLDSFFGPFHLAMPLVLSVSLVELSISSSPSRFVEI